MDDSFQFEDDPDFVDLMNSVAYSNPSSNKKRLSLKRKVSSTKPAVQSPKKPLCRVNSSQKTGWITSAFEVEATGCGSRHTKHSNVQNTKEKLPKPSFPTRESSCSKEQLYEEDWVTKYAPKSRDELSVHVKKVDEVSNWLMAHLKGGILLLTGPPGSGKTATIRTLCSIGYRNQPIELKEWSNEITNQTNSSNMNDEVAQLEEFLFRADRYSLVDENSTVYKALLIEEVPLQFSQDAKPLHSLLHHHLRVGHCPLIIILSDTPTYEFSERFLVPKDVQQRLGITNVHFNPVSNTLLTKAINRIAKYETRKSRMKMPHKSILDDLALQCHGDIRSTVNQLQFLMIRGESKQKSDFNSSYKRDSTLILFHALGKVLYSKRLSEDSAEYALYKSTLPVLPQSLEHIKRPPTNFNPEEVIDQSRLPPPIFAEFVHENAPDFLNSINQFSVFCDYLSFNDAFCSRWFVENDLSQIYSGSLAARAFSWSTVTQDCLPISRRWRPLRRPRIGLVRRSRLNNSSQLRGLLDEHCSQVSSINQNDVLTDYLPFISKFRGITSTWSRRDRELLLSLCLFKRHNQQEVNLLNDGEWGFCENSSEVDDSSIDRFKRKVHNSAEEHVWEYCQEVTASSEVIIDGDSD